MKQVLIRFTEKSQIEENYEVTDEEYDRLIKGEWIGNVIKDDKFWEGVERDLDKFGYCGIIPEVIDKHKGDSLTQLIGAIDYAERLLGIWDDESVMKDERLKKAIEDIDNCILGLKAYTNEFLVLSNRPNIGLKN